MSHGARLLYRCHALPGKRAHIDGSGLDARPPEFIIYLDNSGQLAHALANVFPCPLELTRGAGALKRGAAGAKTKARSAYTGGLQRAARELVALVDNNIV
jgi:hypothetical protein